MRLRQCFATALGAALLLGSLTAQPAGAATSSHRSVAVEGAVAVSMTYRRADLAALPQTTLVDERRGDRPQRHTVTGVLVSTLIQAAQPLVTATAKNANLRVTATVSGRHRAVAVALGELDPSFGNHPALLVLARDGRPVRGAPDLEFPTDTGARRTVPDVQRIRVAVAAPATPTQLDPGAVEITDGRRVVTLTAARLAALPARTRTVSFIAGNGPQQHTETGPTLATVLRAAHVRAGSTTTVAALASDGYVATVTPAEATSGRRPLLLSLVEDGVALDQPRLVLDGDVRGGRYVSAIISLEIAGGCLP